MRIDTVIARALTLTAALCLAGCAHFGPRSIPDDRFDYSAAIGESWKQQTLLNIVKLRYADLPTFLDVASIVSGYSVETSGSIAGQLFESSPGGQDNVVVSGHRTFVDRPTITYMPLTGENFLRELITPIEPKNIFSLLQAGYSADFILGMTVDSLNGVRNRSTVPGSVREAEPEFIRAVELIREVQLAGAMGMRMEEDKPKGSTAVLFFRRDDVPPEIAEKTSEIARLLKMPADQTRFSLVYAPMRTGDDQLAVNSRSILQIMQAFSTYVDVPAEHLKEQRALPAPTSAPDGQGGMLKISSGRHKPPEAYAAVHYRDYWFWIDDRDLRSKRVFSAIMFFFTLTQISDTGHAPVITIPAQ